jgi:Concanavalin A-like lectin/glucanases superfamily/Domain of unknown function (DUF2341)
MASGKVGIVLRFARPALALLLEGCRFDASGLGGEGGGLGQETTDPSGTAGPTTNGTTSVSASESESTSVETTDPDFPAEGTNATSPADLGGIGGSGDQDSSSGGPGCAGDWWDPQWTRRRRIVIAGDGLGAAADMVALLRLDPDRIDYAQTAPDGDDLRFVADGVELDFEIERWGPGGTSTIWLRVPALTAVGAVVAMYYGNAGAPPQSEGAATWPEDYVSVHHLSGFEDATGSGHDANSVTPPTPVGGRFAGAHSFDGADDFLALANESAYDFTTALTVEAWISVTTFDVTWQAIVTKGDDAWRLQRAQNTAAINFGTDPPNDDLNGDVPVDDGGFHYVAIVYGEGVKRIYVDGIQDIEAPLAGPLGTTNHDVSIGSNIQVSGREFSGTIDEVRISGVARDPTYFAWQAASMSDAGVATFGPEQSCD